MLTGGPCPAPAIPCCFISGGTFGGNGAGYCVVISGCVGNAIDGACTGHIEPSGCMANPGAAPGFMVVACDCRGTDGVPEAAWLDGIGAMGVPPVFQTFGGMFIIEGFIAASVCGSDIVVNSSHGTDGSSDGGAGAANSADPPTLRSVQMVNRAGGGQDPSIQRRVSTNLA